MEQINNSKDAGKAALEILTAFVAESAAGDANRRLSSSLLMGHAPNPLPNDCRGIVTLAASLVMLLQISVQAQAAFASTATGRTVSVDDILASLGAAIEAST